jgi:hypothetical protein
MSTSESLGHLRAASDVQEHIERAAALVIEGRVSQFEAVAGGLELTIRELERQAEFSKSVVEYAMRERASLTQADPEQEMDRAGRAYELLGRTRDKADEARGRANALKIQVERVIEMWKGLDFSIVTEPISEAGAAAAEAHELIEELIAHLQGA